MATPVKFSAKPATGGSAFTGGAAPKTRAKKSSGVSAARKGGGKGGGSDGSGKGGYTPKDNHIPD